jgi:hypothetical protein
MEGKETGIRRIRKQGDMQEGWRHAEGKRGVEGKKRGRREEGKSAPTAASCTRHN